MAGTPFLPHLGHSEGFAVYHRTKTLFPFPLSLLMILPTVSCFYRTGIRLPINYLLHDDTYMASATAAQVNTYVRVFVLVYCTLHHMLLIYLPIPRGQSFGRDLTHYIMFLLCPSPAGFVRGVRAPGGGLRRPHWPGGPTLSCSGCGVCRLHMGTRGLLPATHAGTSVSLSIVHLASSFYICHMFKCNRF